MQAKHFRNLMEASTRILIGETHMIGKTVIVKGKKGRVLKQVGSDGNTESDEIYKVKFEDGTVEDIPARDMEIQGDDNKKIGENEAEELVKEATVKRLKGAFKSEWPFHGMSKRREKSNKLPRQLKNKKTEMMVSHPKTGAVSVIDKTEWENYEKKGFGIAESLALEYFENYFDGQLNEDTSDEDIMDAVYDLVDLTDAVTDAVLEAISSEDKLELGESYDEKGLLNPHLTHAVYSKGPSGQIHFTTRREKFAHKKAEMYTNAIQFNQKEHPGFGVMVVPHGTPEGKSVHPDHEKYYGNKNESIALDYFENYFDGQLNESTSDEDIMEAVYDLIDLCEAVLESITNEPNYDSTEDMFIHHDEVKDWESNPDRRGKPTKSFSRKDRRTKRKLNKIYKKKLDAYGSDFKDDYHKWARKQYDPK